MSTNKTGKLSKWIRIDQTFHLPADVRKIINRLNKEGFLVFVVGGSVRDFLINKDSQDHDLVTSATPDEILKIFPDAVSVGKVFGVLKLHTDSGALIDIATFREDLTYSDHRHPDGVKYSGPEEDAARRDFTINGLFFDPKQSAILDCVNGLSDVKSRVIRAIGDPNIRFREDALRLLRAVRFKTSLNFSIEPETEKALVAQARLISKVSGERIRQELSQMLLGPSPDKAFDLLRSTGLLLYILPEVESISSYPVYWKRFIKCLQLFSKSENSRKFTLAWSVVLYKLGIINFLKQRQLKNLGGFEKYSVEIVKKISERLHFSKYETLEIIKIIELHVRFKEVFQMRESTLKKLLREPFFEEALLLHKIDALSSDGNMIFYEFSNSLWSEFKLKPINNTKLINGEDLIELGLLPGPRFSKILETIEDLVLEGKIIQRDQALEYVINHLTEAGD